jgi:hypothetical protein
MSFHATRSLLGYRLPRDRSGGRLLAAFSALLLWATPARAVIIIGPVDSSTGKPAGGQNLSAPFGDPTQSGWQFEGVWQGNFTGTPIAPSYFITANHLGGGIGDTFTFQGVNYTVTNRFLDPNAQDLAIWQVNGTFPTYAALYTGADEAGQAMMVFGRGGPPGPNTANGVALNGWQWPNGGTGLTWGTNQVVSAGPIQDAPTGQYLLYQFDASLGPNTGALTAGDSGGGVFIRKNGVWELAGVNFAAGGPYNTLPSSDPRSTQTAFNASLYDARGLYFDGDNTPIAGQNPVPSQSVSTRVSSEFGWIMSVTGVPEPSSLVLLLAGLGLAAPLARGSVRRVSKP